MARRPNPAFRALWRDRVSRQWISGCQSSNSVSRAVCQVEPSMDGSTNWDS